MSSDERPAYEWLRERGYDVEFNPHIVTFGRRPDFLCTTTKGGNPDVFWAEVKSIEQDDTTAVMSMIWPVVQGIPLPAELKGHATLEVNSTTREQSVRALLKLVHSEAPSHMSAPTSPVFVQQNPDYDDVWYVKVRGVKAQHV
jgi:hypothetical protein